MNKAHFPNMHKKHLLWLSSVSKCQAPETPEIYGGELCSAPKFHSIISPWLLILPLNIILADCHPHFLSVFCQNLIDRLKVTSVWHLSFNQTRAITSQHAVKTLLLVVAFSLPLNLHLITVIKIWVVSMTIMISTLGANTKHVKTTLEGKKTSTHWQAVKSSIGNFKSEANSRNLWNAHSQSCFIANCLKPI